MTLADLGAAALFAWAALPLLALAARAARDADAPSRHRVWISVLVMDLALAAALLARGHLPHLARSAIPVTRAPLALAAVDALMPAHRLGPLAVLDAVWLAATALAGLHAAWRLAQLGAILRRVCPAPESDSMVAWRLARERNQPPPRVLESGEIGVPFAASVWRPAIVLPAKLRERLGDEEALACVLRHELAHLQRGDQGWALLVALLRLPLALHPTARRLSKEISLAREEAVDAAVALEQPHAYARALVDVAAMARLGPATAEAVSMSATALERRVRMIIDRPKKPLARITAPFVVASLLGLAAFVVPRVSARAEGAEGVSTLSPEGDRGLIVLDGKGAEKVIELDAEMTRIAVGDPQIADVKPVGKNQLVISGQGAGKTTVIIWFVDGSRRAYLVKVN